MFRIFVLVLVVSATITFESFDLENEGQGQLVLYS